jgi:micrococcal nuclease
MKYLAALSLLICSIPALADTISGQVVEVSDGDTITVLDAHNKKTYVRLAQIDAPEKFQEFGSASRDTLASLVFGRPVTVQIQAINRYGRTLGKVWVDGMNVNLEQLRRGMAWVYRPYAQDQAYFAAEESARAARVGLWSRRNPIPPWEFRQAQAPGGTQAVGTPQSSVPPEPPYPVTSCAGARNVRECERHLRLLDRDEDGVP